MTYARKSLQLDLANRRSAVFMPLQILGLMTALSVLVGVALGLGSGFPLSQQLQEGFRNNSALIWCIPAFLFRFGVAAFNRNVETAPAFGSTRRHLWLGTYMGFLRTSLALAVGSTAFLALELATNHWFIGAHAFDVAWLGNGSYLTTFCVILVLALLSTATGGLVGAASRAFGPGPRLVVAVGSWVALCVGVIVASKQVDTVFTSLTAWGVWSGVVVGSVLFALAALGSYVATRLATV